MPPTLADDGSWPGVPTPPPTRFACVRHGIQDRGPGGGSAGRANAQHQTVWLASTRVSGCCPRLLGYVNTAIKPEFRGTRVITEAGPAQDLGRSCCSPKRRTRDRRPGQARGHFPIHETGVICEALARVRQASASGRKQSRNGGPAPMPARTGLQAEQSGGRAPPLSFASPVTAPTSPPAFPQTARGSSIACKWRCSSRSGAGLENRYRRSIHRGSQSLLCFCQGRSRIDPVAG